MRLPFNGKNRITQPWSKAHYGLDIVGDDNKAVYAVCAGKVVSSTIITNQKNRTWEWGNYVCVEDNYGARYYYCHLARRSVVAGQRVLEGQELGLMGNTGKSYGAHLHLQIRNKSGKELNVADVLNIKNACGTIIKDNIEKPTTPPKLPLCKLLIGFVSKGDQRRFEILAKELKIPCLVQNKLLTQGLSKLSVGPVSEGDKIKFELLALELAVPCVVI